MTDQLGGLTIGVLGGTGDQGRGLAYRFARSGLSVVLGSRAEQRAQDAAASVGLGVRGLSNADCAAAADVLVVSVPWEGHASLLESLADTIGSRIVVDCVNPIGFDGKGPFALQVPEGSACEQAQVLLPTARVVGSFHHMSHVLLLDPEVESIDCDVMVLGDDRGATDLVQELAARIPGCRGVYAGRLRNAHQVEALTANLIAANRRYKAHAGIRVTDV